MLRGHGHSGVTERAPPRAVLNRQDDNFLRGFFDPIVDEIGIPANRDLTHGIGRLKPASVR